MPLYEYECKQCRRHTEKIQKFSDAEITVCPHCGGVLERVISAPAIAFKGGGWYKDGYGNAAPKAAASSEASSSSTEKSSGTDSSPAKSESTPAAAPAASAAPAPAPPASSSTGK